jgi:hypothetical protein
LNFGAALDIISLANTAAALEITNGTVKLLAFDTRNTVTGVIAASFTSVAPTIASAAGDTYSQVGISALTVTLTGATGVTALDGLSLKLGAVTVAGDTATCTVTTASAIYITPVVAGANVAITNNYMINTSVAGCFLTAAGVWTDASSASLKIDIETLDLDEVPDLLDQVDVKSYKYRDSSDGGFRRIGVIAEEVPDFLAMPNRHGVAAKDLAGVALAGAKYARAEIDELKDDIADIRRLLAGK